MRRILLSILLVSPLVACASPKLMLNAAPLIQPAPELHELDRFVGTWTGTSEIVGPNAQATADQMKAMIPDFEGEMPTTSEGGNKAGWVLGGMFLRTESWHEVAPGMTIRYVDFKTWDPATRKYRGWYFNEIGETGESWFTLDPDGSTFHVTSKGIRADGSSSTGGGSVTFTDEDTMEWTWFEEGKEGKFELRGSNTRR